MRVTVRSDQGAEDLHRATTAPAVLRPDDGGHAAHVAPCGSPTRLVNAASFGLTLMTEG